MNYLSQKFRQLVALTLVISPLTAMGWGADGHVLIADLAMDQQTARQTRALETIARELETRFEFDRRMVNLRVYGSSNDVAKIAAFPDWARDVPLTELFALYDAELPAVLAPLANQDTRSWHYTNQAIETGSLAPSSCQIAPEWGVDRVIPLLIEAWDQADSDISKALVLSFLIHLVADIHQPLHTISRVEDDCRHDLGGNTFCAGAVSATGRCPITLHALWDGGGGLFDRYQEYSQLKQAFESRTAGPAGEDMEISEWLDEGLHQARFVYSLRHDVPPDPSYLEDARFISAQRITLAAERLARILSEL